MSLWDMLNAYGAVAYSMGSTLMAMSAVIKAGVNREGLEYLKRYMAEQLPLLLENCNDLGLTMCALQVDRIIERPQDEWTIEFIRTAFDELHHRLSDELMGISFIHVPLNKASFYETVPLFGEAVAKNLQAANYDIEEAGKCLALDRHTACVMHLMRALEVALDAIGLGIGIASVVIDARNSWERLFREIKKQIEINDKSGDATWQGKRQFFVDSEAHLFSVKNAWRNPTMHLEKKYDCAEAERIFRAVRDFMGHLATHLDESGQFTP